jgi:hypothetical protein
MKTKILALALVAAAPFAASADVSYQYIDLSYQLGGSVDAGGPSIDTDGFTLTGAFPINDNWFVQFDYSSLATDPDVGNFDGYTLSGGWHGETFFATLGYEAADYAGLDDSGYNVDFGARAMVSDSFELNGHVGMSDVGDVGTTTNYGFGAVWMFGDSMGVSFNYDIRNVSDFATVIDIDTDTYGFGFRMNFN